MAMLDNQRVYMVFPVNVPLRNPVIGVLTLSSLVGCLMYCTCTHCSHFYPGPLDQKTLKIDAFDGFQDEFLLPVDRYSDDINDT